MWERRYGFPRPVRDARGVRRYSLEEIDRLTLIARALDAGRRVGDVIGLDTAPLQGSLTVPGPPDPSSVGGVAEQLVSLAERDDPAELADAMRTAALTLGPRRFVLEVADPLVGAVGGAW